MGSNNIKYKFVDTGAKPNFKDPQYSISYHAEKRKIIQRSVIISFLLWQKIRIL